LSFHSDLLEQAEHLANREPKRPKQASLRRAASAAYYAVFHLLIAEGIKATRPTTIRALVRRLYEHGNMKTVCKTWAIGNVANLPEQTRTLVTPPIAPGLQAVAAAFVDLQEARHAADYDLSQTLSRAEALSYVTRARQAFTDWNGVRASSNASIFLAALLFEKQWKAR
jgi:uncharacterized protein (UPF0332 family)